MFLLRHQKISGFLDKNPDIKEFCGYKVLNPEAVIANRRHGNPFIFIASNKYADEIANECKRAGLREGRDFWRPTT